jgi:peptide/nickel transport system permease protein
VVGVLLGSVAALRPGGWIDQMVVALSVVGISAPAFVVGIVFLYIFGLKFGWFPIYGPGSTNVFDRIHHLTLPAITIAFGTMGLVMRITRASMIKELSQDYTYFARARGVPELKVVIVYALRNALVPVVTAAGLLLAGLLGGAVLVETVFGLPGVGNLLVSSVISGDIPMLQGLVLIFAVWVLLFYILLDVIYALLDPRIAYERVAR